MICFDVNGDGTYRVKMKFGKGVDGELIAKTYGEAAACLEHYFSTTSHIGEFENCPMCRNMRETGNAL